MAFGGTGLEILELLSIVVRSLYIVRGQRDEFVSNLIQTTHVWRMFNVYTLSDVKWAWVDLSCLG